MVQHYDDDAYSFHLDHFDSNQHSASTTLSSLHKQRIDTLFRSKRKASQNSQGQARSSTSSTTASRHSSQSALSSSQSNHSLRSEKSVQSKHSSSVTVNGFANTATATTTTSLNSNTNSRNLSPIRGAVSGTSEVFIKPAPTTVIQIHSRPLPPDPRTSNNPPNRVRPQNQTGNTGNNPSNGVRVRQQVQQSNPAQDELEQVFGGRDQRQKAFMDTRSAVQAQIERLFADATRENTSRNQRLTIQDAPLPPPPPPPRAPEPPPPPPSLKTHPAFRHTSPPCSPPSPKRNTPSPHSSGSGSVCSTVSRSSTPPSSQGSSSSPNANMVYRVDYLGAVQLTGKATSLDVLQDPLKQLYYIHKFGLSKGKRLPLSTLSITDAGLRVLRNASSRDAVDFTNPFATIAVWAAIKMVIKKKISNNGQVNYSYAFLPLICDPEAQEKFNTYYPLNVADPTIMEGPHPPMFACVMRKLGETRILECHGFICRSSEDAIVIAANLYQALLGTMNHEASNTSINEPDYVMSDSELTPTRPPRKRRTPPPSAHGSLRRASSEDMLRTSNTLDGYSNRLRRSTSDRHALSILEESEPVPNNKIAAIPRSKSFANMPQALDAHNLFGDPKKKIGLGSIDDVLKAVINPNGMSFSEMDPQHRELLMKMALILTKDEIYRRSKNIMRSHKPRSNSLLSGFESDSDASTITSVIKATKRSISRFGSRASNSLRPSYFKERMPLKKFNTHQGSLNFPKDLKETSLKTMDYSHMLDGSLTRKAPKTPMPKRSQHNSGYSTYSECEYDSECSSKCYCTLPLPKNVNRKHDCTSSGKNNIKNSRVIGNGIKKQGACDCDSESCAESERCYCSLKRIKKNGLKMYEINLDSETDTTGTNGTLKRDKPSSRPPSRYGSHSNLSDAETRSNTWKNSVKSAPRPTDSSPQLTDQSKSRSAGTVFSLNPEVRRQKSISPNMSSYSERSDMMRSSTRSRHGAHPRSRARSTDSILDTSSSRRYRHPSGSLGSQGSGNSGESSSRSSPGLDFQNSSDGSGDSGGSPQPKILLLSAVDPSGKVVYRGASQKKRREGSDTASILSMKKTAEIAALFSELKLNQKTDLIEQLQEQTNVTDSDEEEHYEIMQDNQSFMFSDNIENSLGYLP